MQPTTSNATSVAADWQRDAETVERSSELGHRFQGRRLAKIRKKSCGKGRG